MLILLSIFCEDNPVLSPRRKDFFDEFSLCEFVLFPVCLCFDSYRFEPIFDHVFCAVREEFLTHESPFAAVVEYIVEDGLVLGGCPVAAT